jgi:hypothetical protein
MTMRHPFHGLNSRKKFVVKEFELFVQKKQQPTPPPPPPLEYVPKIGSIFTTNCSKR